MSLITRCPSCGTMFKVVPDQLRISQGWVRCGHCAEVFDASAHLQDREPAPPAPAAVNAPAVIASLGQARLLEKAQQEALEQALAEEAALALADVADAPDTDHAVDEPLYPPFSLLRADVESEPPVETTLGTPAPEPEPLPAAGTSQPEPELGKVAESRLHDMSFVRQARRKAFWRRPGVRTVLLLAGLALAGLLAAQFGVYDRDRLAASYPALRPALEALCQPLACRIGPPKQIEAIVIDSSSFNKLRGDAYRLSFTLKNQAVVPVAMPAMELTLTDSQDQPVIRRVLVPADLGASSGVLPASSEWSGTLAMGVPANGIPGRVAGYRLLAFYP